MNKQQLVDAVGERLGDRRTATKAVEAVLDTVATTLAQGERVSLFGFGVFEKVDRAARTARNPSTGGTVQVPATSVPRFRAGQALKDAVNGGSSRSGTRGTSTAPEPSAKSAPAKAAVKAAPATTKGKDDKAKDTRSKDSKAKESGAKNSKAKDGKAKDGKAKDSKSKDSKAKGKADGKSKSTSK